jgi:hypothetical protein
MLTPFLTYASTTLSPVAPWAVGAPAALGVPSAGFATPWAAAGYSPALGLVVVGPGVGPGPIHAGVGGHDVVSIYP